jgi:hypothetical protein
MNDGRCSGPTGHGFPLYDGKSLAAIERSEEFPFSSARVKETELPEFTKLKEVQDPEARKGISG